jgi:segregation and condensation protein B
MEVTTENDIINYEWDLSTEETPVAVEEETVTATDDFSFEVSHFDEKEQEDMLWMARTGLNEDTLCGAVETIIFMSDRPIAIQKLKAQIDVEIPLRVIHEALIKLQAGYEAKHHGIRLVEVAEGYQFRTKATYSKFVQNLFKVNSLVLTPTALEVLAIIAYKQPVSKNDVEKIRGVDSSHIIRALMDKRLVKMAGRSDELGRPTLYATTEEFLEVFNLADISALPPEYELEEMATKNTLGTIADIKSVVFRNNEGKKLFSADEFEELDKLSEDIQHIASDTIFTSLLKSEEKRKVDGESPVRKSAFDILEDFVNKDASLKQNLSAILSQTLMNVVDPKVVDLGLEGVVHNAPEIDEEFEALRAAEMTELDILENSEEAAMDLEAEGAALEKALDFAFEQLTGEKLQDGEMDFEVDSEIDNLDMSVDQAIMKGKDFDLDLSFLNEVSEEQEENKTHDEE